MKFLLLLVSLLVASSSCNICPSGFTLINGNKCLKYFTQQLGHSEAEVDCTFFGGTLAIPRNSIDNRAISQFAANSGAENTWLGIYCFSNYNVSDCYLDDNSGTPTYSNFYPGFPVVDGIYQGCVYMPTTGSSAGKWISAKCDGTGLPFICEVPVTKEDDDCSHVFNGNCYLPSTELPEASSTYTDFQTAQQFCENHGASLASIHSKQEVNFIRSLFVGSSLVAIGANATLPDTFVWTDGSQWDFDYRNPMYLPSQRNCLQLRVSSYGLWEDADCQYLQQFVCKRPAGKNLPRKEPTEIVHLDLHDFSKCNSTFLMAPVTITSVGYPNYTTIPAYSCTWRIVTIGAYRLGGYISDAQTDNPIVVSDEYGNRMLETTSRSSVIAPTNIAHVTFTGDTKAGHRGFKATFLPV